MMNRDGARQRARAPARKLLNQTSLVRAMGEWAVSPTELVNADRTVMLRGAGNIAFGDPPPTAADEGTGIFIDETGMYGLEVDVVNFYVSAADGKGYFGAGAAVLDADGITIDTAGFAENRIVYADTAGLLSTNDGGVYNPASAIIALRHSSAVATHIEIENTGSGLTTEAARLALIVAGATAGDAYVRVTNGVNAWSFGEDNSDTDAFVITEATTPGGANNRLKIAVGGNVIVPGSTRIGSTGAPTVALDVTGSVKISGTLDLLTTHEAAANPHPDYTTTAELATHTGLPSAHHSSTSNALALTPASVVSSGASTADRHTLGSDIAYPGAVKGIWNQAVLGLVLQGSGSGQDVTIVNRGGTTLIGVGPNTVTLGFYGATPVTKPAPTGSRGGNAALASLLTSLANLGLITDSTSA